MCYWHSGRYSDTERSAAARRGAEAIQRKPLPETPDAMRSPEHAILLLQQVVDELRANTIDTRRANAIAFAVKAAVSCWDVAVSAKLNRLEKLLNGRGRTR